MAKKLYDVQLEYVVREGGYDDDDGNETFEYRTIQVEMEEDEAKNLLCGSASPVEPPYVENARECIVCDVRLAE